MKLPDTIPVAASPAVSQGLALTSTGWVPVGAKYQGQELSYVQFTSPVSITATTEGTATTIVTADVIECDGAPLLIEFYSPQLNKGTTTLTLCLYQDGSSIGQIASGINSVSQGGGTFARRLTPTIGRHTYSIRGFVDAGLTGSVQAGAGGSGNKVPGFIRITRAAGGNV